MANEFIIKHGFHSDGNSQITGSLDISDSLTVNGGAVGAAFPFTGDAQITGSLDVSGSFKVVSPTRGTMLNIDANTLAIGPGASVGGGYTAVAIGHDASTGNNYSVSVGSGATTNANTYAVAIGGASVSANGLGGVAIGGNGTFAGSYGVSMGYQASGTGNYSINLGRSSRSTGANSVTINTSGDTIAAPSNTRAFNVFLSDGTGNPDFIISASNESKLSGSSFTIEKSGSTVFSVIGSEGDLFTITDNLTTGSLFSVKDLSGIPLLDVTANSTIPDVVTVGQSNLLVDSGSLEVVGSISASGDVTGRLQRPTQEFGTNFTASADYSGYYLRTGGNVTCSIQANALPSINSEFDFFQTSSAGNMLFETGSASVILNSKNNNLNLAGQFSSATLKYVGNNTFDLMGDLT